MATDAASRLRLHLKLMSFLDPAARPSMRVRAGAGERCKLIGKEGQCITLREI
jgi:hypothetical protein